jgi:hypothetical protein
MSTVTTPTPLIPVQLKQEERSAFSRALDILLAAGVGLEIPAPSKQPITPPRGIYSKATSW